MNAHTSPTRAALRAFVVVSLALLVIFAGALDFRRIWVPIGDFGYSVDGNDRVVFVADGSPAAKAGMRAGDSIAVQSTPKQFRYAAADAGTPEAGQTITFGLMHNGSVRMLTMTSTTQQTEKYYAGYRIAVLAVAILYIALGAALVLHRPSLMTWGFFLYCLYGAPFTFYAVTFAFPFPWPYIVTALQGVLSSAGLVGLLVFALYFLNDPLRRWRNVAMRTIPWLFAAICASWLAWEYQWGWSGGPPGEIMGRAFFVERVAIALAVMYLFLDTYVRARGQERQRIRWVVVGFALNLLFQVAYDFLNFFVPGTPIWVFHLLQLATVVLPLTVVYAVIKHRVIDVSFVVSRTLVYGVLTTLLVGIFSLLDWFFTDYFRNARLGTIAEVATVFGFGIWFNGLHRRVDALIDATFFRQRHKAEVQLARVASALSQAPTTDTVARFLVNEPVRALSLASAALFKRDLAGVFVREAADGWTKDEVARLDEQDHVLLTLAQTEQGPLSLEDHPWRTEGVPTGPARSVLALPIIVRRELVAIVFYGSHVHGEALDPDEIRAIAALAAGAAAAYDHLEAEAIKREVEEQKGQIDSLRAQLAAAQIQPA